jgi:protein AIR1/2
VECAFCQSRDHVDASCHELWRSFSFNPSTVRKVRSLPVFCYCCGRQGHYGPACGLNPHKTKEGAWETWSQANCDRYQDPASSEMAIAFRTSIGAVSSSERPDLGKSMVPKRHIFFEEADDDDEAEEFIRPPVQKNARVGNISFAGNGGDHGGRRPNKQYNDRNGRPGFTLPPLPPGPPPPLPPQGSHHQNRRNGGRRRAGGARYP